MRQYFRLGRAAFSGELTPSLTCRPRCIGIEVLEPRQLLAAITVTSTADGGPGTLRQAILDSNASVGVKDTIRFNIGGGGLQTIAPLTALPALTDPVTINGTTQRGFNGTPLIKLVGPAASESDSLDGALSLRTDKSEIRGLLIQSPGLAVTVFGNGNQIAGNYINTDATGSTREMPGLTAIAVQGNDNVIGGMSPRDRNLITAFFYGVLVESLEDNTVRPSGNRIQGNYIGVNSTGDASLVSDNINGYFWRVRCLR